MWQTIWVFTHLAMIQISSIYKEYFTNVLINFSQGTVNLLLFCFHYCCCYFSMIFVFLIYLYRKCLLLCFIHKTPYYTNILKQYFNNITRFANVYSHYLLFTFNIKNLAYYLEYWCNVLSLFIIKDYESDNNFFIFLSFGHFEHCMIMQIMWRVQIKYFIFCFNAIFKTFWTTK